MSRPPAYSVTSADRQCAVKRCGNIVTDGFKNCLPCREKQRVANAKFHGSDVEKPDHKCADPECKVMIPWRRKYCDPHRDYWGRKNKHSANERRYTKKDVPVILVPVVVSAPIMGKLTQLEQRQIDTTCAQMDRDRSALAERESRVLAYLLRGAVVPVYDTGSARRAVEYQAPVKVKAVGKYVFGV